MRFDELTPRERVVVYNDLLADLVILMAMEAISGTEDEGQQQADKKRTGQIIK